MVIKYDKQKVEFICMKKCPSEESKAIFKSKIKPF